MKKRERERETEEEEEEDAEEKREVSFGSIGGVTYPHEHAPFDDDDEDIEFT